ncbi:MAG: hypothetical protein ACPG8F_08975 [Flavobacteriaceae bacterium]
MRNKETVIGVIIGLLLTGIGMSLYTLFLSEDSLLNSLMFLYQEKKLGALISLGALLNLPAFFILIRKREYRIAYGLVGVLIILVGVVALLKAI